MLIRKSFSFFAVTFSLVSLVSFALLSCDDHHHGCEGEHTHDPECLQCTGDEDPYDPGFEKTGDRGNFSVRLVAVEPSPHMVGNNTLRIQVVDAGGAPVADATFDLIEPFSVMGGHSTPLAPEVTPVGTNGEYDISQINYLHMGIWELRFDISAGAASDHVVFVFCVAEDPAA